MEDGNRKRRANNGNNAGRLARPEETEPLINESAREPLIAGISRQTQTTDVATVSPVAQPQKETMPSFIDFVIRTNGYRYKWVSPKKQNEEVANETLHNQGSANCVEMQGDSRKMRRDNGKTDENQARPEGTESESNLEKDIVKAIRSEKNSETSTPEDTTLNSNDNFIHKEMDGVVVIGEPEPSAGPIQQSPATYVGSMFEEWKKLFSPVAHQQNRIIPCFTDFIVEAIEAKEHRFKPPADYLEQLEHKKEVKNVLIRPTEVFTYFFLRRSEEQKEVQATEVGIENHLEVEKKEGEDELDRNEVEADVPPGVAAETPVTGAFSGLQVIHEMDESTTSWLKTLQKGLSDHMLKTLGIVLKTHRVQQFLSRPDGGKHTLLECIVDLPPIKPGPSSTTEACPHDVSADIPNDVPESSVHNVESSDATSAAVSEETIEQSPRNRIPLSPYVVVPFDSYIVVPDVSSDESDDSVEM